MKLQLFFPIWYFILSGYAIAGLEPYKTGAVMSGLNGIGSCLEHESWTLLTNPACISADHTQASFFYNRLFGLTELPYVGGVFSWNSPLGGVAGGITRFGNDTYHETTLLAGWAFPLLKENIWVGINLAWNHIGIKNYGNGQVWTSAVGVLIRLTEAYQMGFSIFNINGGKVSQSESSVIPTILRLGSRYCVSEGLNLYAEMIKTTHLDPDLLLGFSFQLTDNVQVRSGTDLTNQQVSGGVSLSLEPLRFHLSYAWHNRLPGTLTYELAYQF